jgi:hypothetical protein
VQLKLEVHQRKVEIGNHGGSEDGITTGVDLECSGGIDGKLRAIAALEGQRSLVLQPARINLIR